MLLLDQPEDLSLLVRPRHVADLPPPPDGVERLIEKITVVEGIWVELAAGTLEQSLARKPVVLQNLPRMQKEGG